MDRQAWLSQVNEPIIDPDREICDPHHHLWHRNGSTYLLPELMEDLDTGHNIVSTVFVDEGMTLKRIKPRAKGRADRILKRSCHITVKVAES